MNVQLRTELFRKNDIFQWSPIINGYVIRAYVAYIIVVIREKLMDIASLMEEVPGTSSYAIDSTL
jgi:hypothetical protein